MQHLGQEISLFVGDLPLDCSDEKLQRLFQSRFKSVKRVQIIKNEDGSSRGFGFIRFEDRADFQAALSQEMKIGNTTLRLDTAHRHGSKNRNRYNSFNSSGSSSSNHHNHHHHFNNNNLHPHHHHNQPHHHHHHHQQQQQQSQHGSQQHQHQSSQLNQSQNNHKTLLPDHNIGSQQQQHHHHQQTSNHQGTGGGARGNSNQHHNAVSGSGAQVGHQHSINSPQQHSHQNTHPNHNFYNSSQQQKSNQHQQAQDNNKNSKPQSSLPLGGDDVNQPQSQNQLHQAPAQQQPNTPQQSQSQTQTQLNLSQVSNNDIGVAAASASITATTTATSTLSSSNLSHSTSAVPNNQHSISTNPQAIGPDLRGYPQTTMMDPSHLLSATEQLSIVPPTSVYGHLYPYGPPPPFGYMPPPPQPNPVIPISAVPPAPPNQASPSSGPSHQHSMTGSNATRYNSAQHQQQHAATDTSAMGMMPAGVQAPQQGPPFYYYYPSPLYFDQSGGATAAAPPNLYHPQTFHPQFFALPNPAYMPNAHTYNQHQPQPPVASQSDASVINPQQPHQPQVNLLTRDIDTTIE